MSQNVLFIHGFASIGRGVKSLQLQNILRGEVIAPDLHHRPLADVDSLSQLIEQHDIRTVVGSSLGGFYALLVALRNPVNLILINPAVRSPMTLQKYIGTVQRYNGDHFEWSQQQVDELTQLSAQIEPENLQHLDHSRVLTLLARHDEVLDYRHATQLLQDTHVIIDEVQDHRFADLQPYAELLRKWHQRQ